jgi:LysM repeat protein
MASDAEHRLRIFSMIGRAIQVLSFSFLLAGASLLSAADSQYAIKEGETLFSVARKAQVPVDILSAYNGIADAAKVRVGTVIRVPLSYPVKKGDTLFGIARSFSVSLGKILDLNRLPQDARLRVGDHLFIPADASSPQQVTQQTVKTGQGVTNQEAMPAVGIALVWPHMGRREPIKGKITGLVIHGAAGDVVHSATAGEVKWAASYWGLGKIVIIK